LECVSGGLAGAVGLLPPSETLVLVEPYQARWAIKLELERRPPRSLVHSHPRSGELYLYHPRRFTYLAIE
jgi:hypothetical protein